MSLSSPAVSTRPRVLVVLAALAAMVGALLLAMSWQSSASADPAYPPTNSCSFSSADGSSFTPGEQVTLLGSGYGSNEQVQLSIHSQNESLGTVTTDANGGFQTTVTIPADLGSGSHVLTASSPSASCSFDPTVGTSSHNTKHLGVAGVSTSKPNSSGLASTGFQTATAVTLGVVILGGGVLLMVVGRRRKA